MSKGGVLRGATRMNYSSISPKNSDIKSWHDGTFMKKIVSWKADHTNPYLRKLEQKEWIKGGKLDILKKLGVLKGDFKRFQRGDKFRFMRSRWFSKRNKGCNTNPVPEPATMLLLGAGLIAITGFGRKKLTNKAKK